MGIFHRKVLGRRFNEEKEIAARWKRDKSVLILGLRNVRGFVIQEKRKQERKKIHDTTRLTTLEPALVDDGVSYQAVGQGGFDFL